MLFRKFISIPLLFPQSADRRRHAAHRRHRQRADHVGRARRRLDLQPPVLDRHRQESHRAVRPAGKHEEDPHQR